MRKCVAKPFPSAPYVRTEWAYMRSGWFLLPVSDGINCVARIIFDVMERIYELNSYAPGMTWDEKIRHDAHNMERIERLREQDREFFFLVRVGEKFDELMKSAATDRKKSGKLSVDTLERQRALKAYRRTILERGDVTFEALTAYEKEHNYNFKL